MASWLRRHILVLAVVLIAAVLIPAAFGDYDYFYYSQYVGAGGGGGDLTNSYRYFNDSCSGDGYGWTKSIYGLTDGSWVVAVEAYDACGFNKAHLNPSGSYGLSHVQSKCRNTDSGTLYLICDTSRP